MTEEELHTEKHRGDRAAALLKNPILQEAFDRVDAECVRLWREAKDAEVREGMWLRLQSLHHVKSAIEGIVQKGDLADRKLKQLITGKKSVF